MCPRGASGVGTAVVYKGACCGVQCDRTGVDFMPSQAAVERPCHVTTVRAAYTSIISKRITSCCKTTSAGHSQAKELELLHCCN